MSTVDQASRIRMATPFQIGSPSSPTAPQSTSTPAGDGLNASGETNASNPQQDHAAASVIANLPRACPDGCGCPACAADPKDPAGALKARDKEVEAHEQAHLTEAGPDANGAPEYETQTGPDGKSYRVGGHVNVSMKEDENDPKGTLQRMQRIKRAALKPATPSGQDQKVAAEADQKAAKAQAKIDKTTLGGHAPGSPPVQT